MRSLAKLTAYSMIVALTAALIVSCEDSALLAPTDSVFTVTASPETVVIDEPGGEIEGESLITAQIFDASNFPMQGVEITFTADGGTLSDPDDPEATAPIMKETNVQGVATVRLTVTLDDADETTVTARSGIIGETAVVTLSVVPENQFPEAFIAVDPENSALLGDSVLFDGRGSADPDGDAITCYKWEFSFFFDEASGLDDYVEVIQGNGRATVLERFTVEQEIDVELRVSDDPGWAAFCTECVGPPGACGANNSAFGTADFIPGYEIVCDPTDPIANAGPDKTVTLDPGETTVSVELNGSASQDPESDELQYAWDCGNGQTFDTAVADCVYTAGNWTAGLIVTNDCGRTDYDSAEVRVNEP
jgi:hypothetical protein